ncbi:MAG: 50S ribosomal protein L31e [Candidatus Nitrosotenuis sp.]|nr:50S ribosomal protein L31e [Candidatus Nitrosotenuis sp.]
MSQEAERVYTINLGKVWLSPNNQRAKRAINMIREFSAHHMKTEQIKIDPELSQVVWARGIRSPPRKIRVKMAKTDDGYVMVSPYEEETKVEDKPKKDKKADAKVEEKAESKTGEKAEEKTEAAPKDEKKAKKSEAKPAKKSKAKSKSKKK